MKDRDHLKKLLHSQRTILTDNNWNCITRENDLSTMKEIEKEKNILLSLN